MEAQRIHVDDGAGNKYDLYDVDGVLFPEYFTTDPVQRLQDIKNLVARDDDVVIVAYPKAGTHWVWEMTNMLLRQTTDYHQSMKEAQMIELTETSVIDKLDSPRVLNTHLPFDKLPTDMIKRRCKLIYITRNPKDMAVSRYCHNSKGVVGYKGTFSDYLPLYMKGQVAFGSWFDFTNDWTKVIEDKSDYPIHTLVYEQLKRNTTEEVSKLASFLGLKKDPSFIQDVCDKCSFTQLKDSYMKAKQIHLFKDNHNPQAYAFRKGQIGDWKNWFTVAQNEMFDAEILKKMPSLADSFIYE
ncbi:sulfotransferase 1 [Mactra antiquata]